MSRPTTIPSVISQLRNIFPANAADGYYRVAGVTFRPSDPARPTIISIQNGEETEYYSLSQNSITRLGEGAMFDENSHELDLVESQDLYARVRGRIPGGPMAANFIPDIARAAQIQADAQLAQGLAPAPAIRGAQAGQLQHQEIAQEEAAALIHANAIFAQIDARRLDGQPAARADHDRPSPSPRALQAFRVHFNRANDITSGVRSVVLEFDRERGIGMGNDRNI